MNTNGLTAAQVAELRSELDTLRYQAMANHESQRGVAFSTAISLINAACAAPATVDTRPLYERIAPATERFGELFHQSLCESEPIDVTEDGLSEEAIRNITQIAERAFECYHELTNVEPPLPAPTGGGETAPFILNAEEREVVEQIIDAYMSSRTRVAQDGVIVALNNRLTAAKNATETASPEPDKDFADRVHHPVDDLPWDIALERRGLKIDPPK